MIDSDLLEVKNKHKAIEKAQEEFRDRAMQIIEKEARKILSEHKNLGEFVMAMGSWFFTRVNSKYHVNVDSQFKYLNELKDFFTDWDADYGLTGCPVRFTARGGAINDW